MPSLAVLIFSLGLQVSPKPLKRALVDDGIPYTSFAVTDVQAEYDRLKAAGVQFAQPPVDMGPVKTAVLDDTCGNLIQIASRPN